ncbi:MAG: Quinoprotein glucose dehydrogenase B precursor [candidate division WS6 bacterium OLB20]|uniref:Quinoprotein glucose dehydrogenase B n=1 Tax=candidate division WS6 bacterium OLB20 TaxID=1617426 RepID=A0A136M0C1_9BACT|nr:MAG: Quinoprotein glucose dehydrogenase B precursor [candidate division WS6 bacterium OLB20]
MVQTHHTPADTGSRRTGLNTAVALVAQLLPAAAIGALVLVISVTVGVDSHPVAPAPAQPVQMTPVPFSDLVPFTLDIPKQFSAERNGVKKQMFLPRGFEISVYASGFSHPRFFVFGPANEMYITDRSTGTVSVVRDRDNDGRADQTAVVTGGLDQPHGLDLHNGDLYVAEQGNVHVFRSIRPDGTFAAREIVIDDLPVLAPHDDKHVWHATRTLVVGPDQKIYIAAGSGCDHCLEEDPARAAIMRYNLDGSGKELFARGLRNTVGIYFEQTPAGYRMWGTDNGNEDIGEDLPPDEINLIEKGKDYGWPYCYGDDSEQPGFAGSKPYCENVQTKPVGLLPAHSAPIGLSMMPAAGNSQKQQFPDDYSSKLFIALQGSNPGNIPSGQLRGQKVVTFDTETHEVRDFVTGWFDPVSKERWDTLVGIGFDRNGAMYVSGRDTGYIYRVVYTGD